MKKILTVILAALVIVVTLNADFNMINADIYVAEIGETKYESLSEAISSSVDGDVITILADCTTPANTLLIADKKITIDLNGNTISDGTWFSDGKVFQIRKNTINTSLTIKDSSTDKEGKIIDSNIKNLFWVEGDGSSLIIESGSFEQYKGDSNMFTAKNGAKITVKNGNFSTTIPVTKKNQGNGLLVSFGSDGSGKNSIITLNGGIFESADSNTNPGETNKSYISTTDAIGQIEVYGGSFKTEHLGHALAVFNSISIAGGNFNAEETAAIQGGDTIKLENIIDEDYEIFEVAEDTSYPYHIKIEAFEIGEDTYSTFDEAYRAAKSKNTIKVLRDGKLTESYDVGKELIIDLNGFTLSSESSSGYAFKIIKDGKLTVKDSSSLKNGKLCSTNKNRQLFNIDGGKLTINSGNFEIKIDSYKSYVNLILCQAGTVKLNGGTYSVLTGKKDVENLYSSVIAATQLDENRTSVVNINGGIYNAASEDDFESRIFTSYKSYETKDGSKDNFDFGVINVNGGNFNGNYNNQEQTGAKAYTNITGGSFDRDSFKGGLKLSDMIDLSEYTVKTVSGQETRYEVQKIKKPVVEHYDFKVVNTCTK